MKKIKKDDLVKVLVGKDKGKTGKIKKIDHKRNKVVVEQCNMIKKHLKPTKESKGGIIDLEGPLDISNIMLLCPSTKKPAKVTYKKVGSKKQRVLNVK